MALSPAETERQYNARAAIPDHPDIFARWARASADTRSVLRPACDIRYGEHPCQVLDHFRAKGPAALVFIHGGYWRSLDKSDFSFIAPAFVERGAHVVAINYALAPTVSIEDIVRQVLAACAWLWRHATALGIDRNRIHLAGHSAGAHLASMMLAAEWPAYGESLPGLLVRSALAVSGLFDLRPLVDAAFLKDDLRLTRQSALRASPWKYTPNHRSRLFTAVGSLESDEFKRQSALIARAWPSCFSGHLEVDQANHLTVVDRLADPREPLHMLAARMIGVA